VRPAQVHFSCEASVLCKGAVLRDLSRGIANGVFLCASVFAFLTLSPAGLHAASVPVPTKEVSSHSIEQFRKLLSMPQKDRAGMLGSESEVRRKLLERKLAEYDALPPEERESRLRVTQLRAYLLPLMTAPPDSRASLLSSVPGEWRPVIEQRLQLWDILPPPLQKEVLAYESTIHFFLRLESSPPSSRGAISASMTEDRRRSMEASLTEFQALDPDEQRQAFERFQGFFGLSESDRQRALRQLAKSSKLQVEPFLNTLALMNTSDRQGLFESFQKFAKLTPEDRSLFLVNAERWEAMDPGERRAWRGILTSLPPLPPGFEAVRPSLPGAQPASAPLPALNTVR